jgi:regulator of sirC expression with transglutaminase-like and TPR domain
MDPTARLRALLRADPPGFPLDEAALLIAAHERPELDVGAHLGELDALAGTVAEATFASLVATLFGPGGFTGNTTDYYDPENSLLDSVLGRRVGIPILLAVVAIEVGRRRGIPVLGIGMPGHFLIRSASNPDQFADPFTGPALLDKDGCRAIFSHLAKNPAHWNETYLSPTNRRDIVVRILNNLKMVHQRRNDHLRLGRVMTMRSVVPGLGERERDEFRRLMAPMN